MSDHSLGVPFHKRTEVPAMHCVVVGYIDLVTWVLPVDWSDRMEFVMALDLNQITSINRFLDNGIPLSHLAGSMAVASNAERL